jgi:hypothetical protein
MSLLITFWNGHYSQFDECDGIDFILGLVRIYENNVSYEYDEGEVKEIIFVNEYTLSHAIDEGYVI